MTNESGCQYAHVAKMKRFPGQTLNMKKYFKENYYTLV